MIMQPSLKSTVIQAAGGIVWRNTKEGPKLALVHRPEYNDWSLPKGKLHPGESWQTAALREVFEETGCEVQIENFAGSISYTVNGFPKVVRFWNMLAHDVPESYTNGEVDRIVWLSKQEAVKLIEYREERGLIALQPLFGENSMPEQGETFEST